MDRQVAQEYSGRMAGAMSEYNSYMGSKSRSEIEGGINEAFAGLGNPQAKLQGQLSGLINEGLSTMASEAGLKFINTNAIKPLGNYLRTSAADPDISKGRVDALNEVKEKYSTENLRSGDDFKEARDSFYDEKAGRVAQNQSDIESAQADIEQTTRAIGGRVGVQGVSPSGDIQVSSDITRPDPTPTAEPSGGLEPSVAEPSSLPVEGLGELAPSSLAPPAAPRSIYTSADQTGLSEEGYAARASTFSERFSQGAVKVLPDKDPPLSDMMDRMQRGDLTLGDSAAEAVSQEQAGGRLSGLLDTSAEQRATTSFGYGGATEQEAIARGAPSVDVGGGERAITQAELQQAPPRPPTQPTQSQPEVSSGEVGGDSGIDQLAQQQSQLAEKQSNLEDLQKQGQSIEQETFEGSKGIAAEQANLEGQITTAATGEEASGILGGIGEGAAATLGALGGVLDVAMPLAGIGLGIAGIFTGIEDANKEKRAEAQQSQEKMTIQTNAAFDDAMVGGRQNFGSQALMANLDTSKFQSQAYAHF